MDNSGGSDRSLLDRLNALKPTPITLDQPSKHTYTKHLDRFSSVSNNDSSQPVSKEDALSERLKSLRLQAESKDSTSPEPKTQPNAQSLSTQREAQPQTSNIAVDSTSSTSPHGSTTATTTATTLPGNTIDDIDPLLVTDDQTLEELLAELASDEQWLEEVAAEVSADEEQRKVAALLKELGEASLKDSDSGKADHRKFQEDEDESSDDDSDGEDMQREADDNLAQAMDEIEWVKQNEPQSVTPKRTIPVHSGVDEKPATSTQQNLEPISSTGASKPVSSDPFNLPSVPSDLQEQPDLPDPSQQDASFEAEIASRMAKLKGAGQPGKSLPSVPTSQVDELGLPVVPTFDPEDRPVGGVYKRYGYTVEDEKSWCTVCLEDGAIRCIGCDGDVYCARCWKEMHVGPRAGYEERGHQWEKFVRGR